MKDPRPLVQFTYEKQIEIYLTRMRTSYYPSIDLFKSQLPDLYEMQIEDYLNWMRIGDDVPSIDVDLFRLFYTEATVKLPDHPLHNKFLNFYNHRMDDRMNRPRDTNKIYFPSRVYHFDYMEEGAVFEDHLSVAAQTPNCAMFSKQEIQVVTHLQMFDVKCQDSSLTPPRMKNPQCLHLNGCNLQTPNCTMTIIYPREARDVLLVFSEISKQQPVTHLCMLYVTCRDSSLTAPRMINPQSLCLQGCDLPDQFVRSLIQQLFGAGDSLQKLRLVGMDLSPFEPLLDELLENLVTHHEAHKGQRKLELRRGYENKLSQDFRERWREQSQGVESIYCYIDDDQVRSSVPSLEPLIQTNSNSL